MSQAVLHHREHIAILAPFRKDQTLGSEPDLLKSGGVQVEPAYHPQNSSVRRGCRSRRDAGNEKGRRSLVAERRSSRRDFVQGAAVETVLREPIVDLGHGEGQGRRLAGAHVGDRLPQVRQDLGSGSSLRHQADSTHSFAICSPTGRAWSRESIVSATEEETLGALCDRGPALESREHANRLAVARSPASVRRLSTIPGRSVDRRGIPKAADPSTRSSPVSPCPTDRFGKTQSGTDFGKAGPPDTS